MLSENKVPNRLIHENSPYLLQHAYNPVDWYPWGDEAFEKARQEDKPIFLSIGYSTCHWCHVMEQESFEDEEVAELLNQHFIAIKVDREIRPDIDSTYMSVCQAITGNGGWPLSIVMTAAQKPFFAGTYFPKRAAYGQMGFMDILTLISKRWREDKDTLISSADTITEILTKSDPYPKQKSNVFSEETMTHLIETAFHMYSSSYDKKNGGFGDAPKFPSAHNLLFLLSYFRQTKNDHALAMAEHTLTQMYKGGLFDHIGGGFSRYSTDAYFLVPHFEKMLYDNALLMMAYANAYYLTGNALCQKSAEKTAHYILREMTAPGGGFYSAQDADSEGVEGKYYVFTKEEVESLLGEEEGEKFCLFYGFRDSGNFEGKNIPNLLHHNNTENGKRLDEPEGSIAALYQYRKSRTQLSLDDKILTSWNALMISAFAVMYRVFHKKEYLDAACCAEEFLANNLLAEDGLTLYVGFRDGKPMQKGYLEDYAFFIFALLNLYDATLKKKHLLKAQALLGKVVKDFYDSESGGFYLYGKKNEPLFHRPKESYDGALPSGNSVMTYNLVRLAALCPEKDYSAIITKQISWQCALIGDYPAGNAFFLTALLRRQSPPPHIVCVLADKGADCEAACREHLRLHADLNADILLLEEPTAKYPLLNGKTTYYVCQNRSCLPPMNELP